MLDYTKMAIKQTVTDLKRTDYIRNVITQIIYITYLIYTLIVGTGILAVNIILLALSVAYFIFFLSMTSLGKTPEGKTVKKVGRNIYVWCKRLIKLFTLGLTVYGICTAVEHVSPLSVILAALMIVGWLLQIVFEVLIKILTNRVNFILEGLEADLDNMLKPVRSVGNFFKKMTGQETTPQKELTENQLKLKEKVDAYRAEKKRKREEAKQARDLERENAKQAAKDDKRSAKLQDKLIRMADKKERKALRKNKALAEQDELVQDEQTELMESAPLLLTSTQSDTNSDTETAVAADMPPSNEGDEVFYGAEEKKKSSSLFRKIFRKKQ